MIVREHCLITLVQTSIIDIIMQHSPITKNINIIMSIISLNENWLAKIIPTQSFEEQMHKSTPFTVVVKTNKVIHVMVEGHRYIFRISKGVYDLAFIYFKAPR